MRALEKYKWHNLIPIYGEGQSAKLKPRTPLIRISMEFDKPKVAGTIIFAGVAQLILAIIIAETLYPGYSTFANFISDLGIGPSAYLFNASIILLGVAFMIGAFLIYSALKPKLFTILLTFCGIGILGLGIFTEDLLIAHGISSKIAFMFGGLATIVSYKMIHSPLKYGSVILGLFGLSALVIAMTGNTLGMGVGGDRTHDSLSATNLGN